MKKVLIILGFTFCCLEITAQEKKLGVPPSKPDSLKTPQAVLTEADDRAKKFLPQYAPLSPNASILQKFGDYQVNLATGVPSISIPLLVVQNGSLSVPITLNYHAGGFKLNEMASWVGWGFSLDFGPSINRTVQGLKDDNDGGSYLSNPIISRDLCYNITDFNYSKSVVKNETDAQPDIFSYKTLDKSGKFLLGQNGATPFKIPNYPIQLSYSGSPTISSFNLVDDSGVQYVFGSGESQEVTSGSSTQNYNSSWLISQIKSPNTDDEINYSYQSGGSQSLYEKQWVSSLLYGAVGGHYSNSTSSTPVPINVSTTITQINPYKITYTNGEVEFIQSNAGERLDLTGSRYLKQINVYNYENGIKILFKVIKFSYSYFSGIRLKLNKITITDASDTTVEEYSFDYWTNTISWNEVIDNEKKDFFGYYNGKLNTHLIPVSSYQGILIDGGAADRSTVDTYMKEGVLKRITFPTKGYTEFNYETNKFNDGTNDLFAGGLRVKSIKSFSGGSTLLKRYEYSSSAGAGIGRLTTNWTPTNATVPTIQYLRYDDQEGNAQSFGTVYQASFTQSGGAVELNTMDAAPVYYTDVTEYFEDVSDPTKNGKNVYTFDFENDVIANPFTYPTRNVKPWKRGNLLAKLTYDKDNNLLSSLSNQYQEHQVNTRVAGAFVHVPNIYSGFENGSCPTGLSGSFPEMVYGSVSYQTGINLLVSNTNVIDNISSSQNTDYTANLLVVQSQSTDSRTGDTKTASFVYPSDASYSANAIAQSMVTRNMLNTPLETSINETVSSNTTTIYKEKKVFDLFTGSNARGLSNNILLKELWSAPKGGTLEKRVAFTDYATNGNPLSYKVDDLPISLFWGYNDALLLAEVKNATKSELDAALSTAGITANDFSVNNLSAGALSQLQTLRNALPVRQVSWFTHRPFVGIAQVMGGDGIKTAFVFDALNRLKLIKDHDLNITDKYSYSYATTLSTCTTPTPPTISIANTSLCNVTLSASNCSGAINWSNGNTGNTIIVPTATSSTITATCSVSGCISSHSAAINIPALPTNWLSTDIGIPSIAGCTQYNNSAIEISGKGYDFNTSNGNTTDQFHYVYQVQTGDITITAKISSLIATADKRTGIMFRSSTNDNAQYYSLIQDGNGAVALLKRNADGAGRDFVTFAAGLPINSTWLRIIKTGNGFSALYSSDGTIWQTLSTGISLSFSSNFLIGFVVYDDNGGTNQSTFTNITINGNAF